MLFLSAKQTCWKGSSKEHVEEVLWGDICFTSPVEVKSTIAWLIAGIFAACEIILFAFFWIT